MRLISNGLPRGRRSAQRNGVPGSVLIGVLWCVVLLSVVVIGALHSARIDLITGKNHTDRIQAHYLALAGVERAKALLYHDMLERRQTAKNHTGTLYTGSAQFQPVSFGPGKFQIFRKGTSEEGGVVFGIQDEESRLNVNTASAEELGKLEGMTPAVANSIVQWRTSDTSAVQGGAGADAEYYASLRPPYMPRRGPYETVRELLFVRGVTRELLLGMDTKQNGLLDSEAEISTGEHGSRNGGWASVLTVDSVIKNQNASGNDRVNVQNADESTLTTVQGITADIAKAIVARRGQNRINTLADLLDVPAAPAGNQRRGQQQQQNDGPKVISQELLQQIADDVTTAADSEQKGLININTAGVEVLSCLPQISPDLAKAIVTYRKSNGYFANVAGLFQVSGMTRDIFKAIAPRITARSETFRIISEGTVNSTGARQRIQVIVHIARQDVQTLSYREDL